jgi:hypothetical protein
MDSIDLVTEEVFSEASTRVKNNSPCIKLTLTERAKRSDDKSVLCVGAACELQRLVHETEEKVESRVG